MLKKEYVKPKCDCGEPLMVHVSYTLSRIYRVTFEGKIHSRRTSVKKKPHDHYLVCTNEHCNRRYKLQLDRKNRIIRGELKQGTVSGDGSC